MCILRSPSHNYYLNYLSCMRLMTHCLHDLLVAPFDTKLNTSDSGLHHTIAIAYMAELAE